MKGQQEPNRVFEANLRRLNAEITTTVKAATDKMLVDTAKSLDDKAAQITNGLDQIFKNYETRVSNKTTLEWMIVFLVFVDAMAHLIPYVPVLSKIFK